MYLHYQGFKAIENLEEYSGVRALWLEHNAIKSLDGLQCCTGLTSLFLQGNLIDRISCTDALTSLVTLNLANNRITELQGLAHLPHLETLNVSKNALASPESIQHLAECPALKTVHLANNELPAEGVLPVLVAMPHLAVLDLQGNPFVRATKSYRKTLITSLPKLSFLDDRPVFEGERVAATAWASGGREAEASARQAFRDAAATQRRDRMTSFWEWTEQVKAKRAAQLEELNAERVQKGLEPLATLPSRKHVSYGRVEHAAEGADLTAEQAEDARVQAIVDRIEAAGAAGHGVSDDALAGIAKDFAGAHACPAVLPGSDGGVAESKVSDTAHSGEAAAAMPPPVPETQGQATAEPAQAAPTTPEAVPPQVPELPTESDAVRASLRLVQERRAGGAPLPASTPQHSPGVQVTWWPALDKALSRAVKKYAFDFSKTAKALAAALRRGIVAPPPTSPASAGITAGALDATQCRLRWTALAAPEAEPQDSATPSPPTSVPHTGDVLPLAGSEPGVAPAKPLSRLLQGDFELTSFQEYVKVSQPLPSMQPEAGTGEGPGCEESDEEADEEGDAVPLAPLTRGEIMDSLRAGRTAGAGAATSTRLGHLHTVGLPPAGSDRPSSRASMSSHGSSSVGGSDGLGNGSESVASSVTDVDGLD